MVKISVEYSGEKHCLLTHEPSRSQIETDAPKDNQGKGERFSPTDLVGAALSSCILTTIAIISEREGVNVKGMRAETVKEMTGPPRRIGSLKTKVWVPATVPVDYRQKLEQIANGCPVHKSLSPDIDASIEFIYET